MSVKITSSGKGLADILKNIKSPSIKKVTVGIHGFEEEKLVSYATANEFGLGVTERPFIRQTFDKFADELKEIGVEFGQAAAAGDLPLNEALFAWGQAFAAMINSEIRDGDNFAPNTPERIEQKGTGKHPLQDKGDLQRAIKAVVS